MYLNIVYALMLHCIVRLIDCKVLSSIYPAMNSSFFSSVMAVFDKGQPIDINNSCIPLVTQRDCVSYIPLGTTV